MKWNYYNIGEVKNLVLFDRHGKLFTGQISEFLKLHKGLCGFTNEKKMVLLINDFGEIAGKGKL